MAFAFQAKPWSWSHSRNELTSNKETRSDLSATKESSRLTDTANKANTASTANTTNTANRVNTANTANIASIEKALCEVTICLEVNSNAKGFTENGFQFTNFICTDKSVVNQKVRGT